MIPWDPEERERIIKRTKCPGCGGRTSSPGELCEGEKSPMIYVIIEGSTYPINTIDEIEHARAAMRQCGQESADVWTSPATLESIEESGDADGYKNGQRLYER